MSDPRLAYLAVAVLLSGPACFTDADPSATTTTGADSGTDVTGGGSTTGGADESSGDSTPATTDDTGDVELHHAAAIVNGLETLAAGFHYEGWALIDGAPVSIGKFNSSTSTPAASSPTSRGSRSREVCSMEVGICESPPSSS